MTCWATQGPRGLLSHCTQKPSGPLSLGPEHQMAIPGATAASCHTSLHCVRLCGVHGTVMGSRYLALSEQRVLR